MGYQGYTVFSDMGINFFSEHQLKGTKVKTHFAVKSRWYWKQSFRVIGSKHSGGEYITLLEDLVWCYINNCCCLLTHFCCLLIGCLVHSAQCRDWLVSVSQRTRAAVCRPPRPWEQETQLCQTRVSTPLA